MVKVKYTIYTIAGALAFNNYSDAFGGVTPNSPITALAIDCAGSETSLQSCPINTNTSFQCDSRSDVGVVCQGNSLVNQARIDLAQCTSHICDLLLPSMFATIIYSERYFTFKLYGW